jgi:hypothetical protein
MFSLSCFPPLKAHLLRISSQSQLSRFQDRDPTYRLDCLSRFINYTDIELQVVELLGTSRMACCQHDLLSIFSPSDITHVLPEQL